MKNNGKKVVPATECAPNPHTPKPPSNKDLYSEDLYINRELSWLEFNSRVLEEAEDLMHPLLERLKFLSIFSTNLDEFFMVRVAGLMEQRDMGVTELSPDGSTPNEQLHEIRTRLIPLYKRQAEILNTDVLPKLDEQGIHILPFESLSPQERADLESDFLDNILPVLTPLALDTGHPFPRLLNRSLNIVFVLFDAAELDAEMRVGVLQVPSTLPRLHKVHRESGYNFIPLEEIIRAHANVLFPGLRLKESYTFRVTRDADVAIAEDEANDLITAVAEGIRQRRWGTDAVRLEVGRDMPAYILDVLVRSLELSASDVYHVDIPLNLQDFLLLTRLEKRKLKDPPFTSRVVPQFASDTASVFDVLKKEDVMVHHPFDSFTNSVVKFIAAAASDAHVQAIKITLYRTGGKSPVVEALKLAAQNGKNVTAFVELKARFDEEANINWARELENSGVHVVYGVQGLKVHCKLCLVVRREGTKMLTYAHVSTGNYNLATSRQYTDIGIFTGRQEFEQDFVHLFNLLTGYSKHSDWQYLGVSPINLRSRFMDLIHREISVAEQGGRARIIAKMNALTDPEIIRALYKASIAGVQIQLLVRGMCCLRPGISGVSETITVISILDRFLEHSRIFWFANNGNPEVYIGSADLMGRNLDRRIELLFPVRDNKLKAQLLQILEVYLSSAAKGRYLQSDGTYLRPPHYKSPDAIRVQSTFLRMAKQ